MPNYAISLNHADKLTISPVVQSTSTEWRLDVRFKIDAIETWVTFLNLNSNRFQTSITARYTSQYFGRDEVSIRINNTTFRFDAPNASQTFSDGEYHELSFVCDGALLTCYRDGVQLDDALACTFTMSDFDLIGDQRSIAMPGSVEFIRFYESTDTSALVHAWDANASDTTNTGAAPVMVDTVAGRNAVGGATFPADGTAWVSYNPPADVTPDVFDLGEVLNQPLSGFAESSIITVTGVDAATDIPISIVGGEYRVSTDGGNTFGAYTAASGNVQLNHQVQVRVATSADQGTQTSATLTIGGVADTFTATTIAPPQMTLDQASFSYGNTLTWSSDMTDGTSAKVIDSSLNELALTAFVNNGNGTYSAQVPALTDGLVGILSGAVTIEMANATETSTDTSVLAPLAGYSEYIASFQSGQLTIDDWGYVGVGGLANAVTVGDILWHEDIAGLDPAINGLYIYDFAVFTPPITTTFYIQDIETRTWSAITNTWQSEQVPVNPPVITVSGSPTTTIPFNGTLPVFTASTNDGSAVVVSGDTPVNNVAGTYVIRYNASNAAGAAAEVTRTVIVEADIVVPVPVITVSGQATTAIAFGGVLPVFTAFTNDGSAVIVSGDTPVNNVAGTYVVRFNASNAGGAAVEVTRTVIVEAEVVGPVDPVEPVTTTVERRYTVTASLQNMPQLQPIQIYQGDRLRVTVTHPFDMTNKQMTFKFASSAGQTAKLATNVIDGDAVMTSAQTATLKISIKAWQLVLQEGAAEVVVGEGTCQVRPRIRAN